MLVEPSLLVMNTPQPGDYGPSVGVSHDNWRNRTGVDCVLNSGDVSSQRAPVQLRRNDSDAAFPEFVREERQVCRLVPHAMHKDDIPNLFHPASVEVSER